MLTCPIDRQPFSGQLGNYRVNYFGCGATSPNFFRGAADDLQLGFQLADPAPGRGRPAKRTQARLGVSSATTTRSR
jgi:hypothetical protein